MGSITTRSARVAAIVRAKQERRAFSTPADRWQALAGIGRGVIPDWVPDRDPTHDRYSLEKTLADGSWAGHRAFIVGGGPSLRGFDFSRLKGELVIAVNRAYEHVDAQIMASMDGRLYHWIVKGVLGPEAQQRFSDFQGIKLWLNLGEPVGRDAHVVPCLGNLGVPGSLVDGAYHGNNSGYFALQVAYCLGADPIYLLGFDMKFDGNRTHFHDGYPSKDPERVLDRFKGSFEHFAKERPAGAPRIVNLNPDSGLRCFEFGDIGDLAMPPRPLCVTFYTNDSYRAEADKFTASCRRFNLPFEAWPVKDRGGWQANNQYKPVFLRQVLDRVRPRPVMWLDADASFRAQPFLLDTLTADAAVHYRDGHELLGSAIYLANNQKARELLDLWIVENESHPPDRFDQANLDDAIGKWDGVLYNLPPQYCQIYDIMSDVKDPVITQYQASRRLKNSPAVLSVAAPHEADLVSVMMPAFNADRYIDEAIQSVLRQTYRNLELVVVDDGSTDRTEEIAARWAVKDSRVRLIRQDKNMGEAVARNRAVAESRGRYIARLDADDWDSPDRIEKAVARLNSTPWVDCVSSRMVMVYGDRHVPVTDCDRGMIPALWMAGRRGGDPVNASIVAKRDIYDLVGSFDPTFRVGTDTDWDARACLAGARWGFVDEVNYFYRKYDGQLTSDYQPHEKSLVLGTIAQKYRQVWDADYNPKRQIQVLALGACNRACPHCSQALYRSDHRDRQMGQEEIDLLIDQLKTVNAGYLWLEFSGGEPTLWPLLESALGQVKESEAALKTRIFTNGLDIPKVRALLDSGALDQAYFANPLETGSNIDGLEGVYPGRVVVERYRHKPLPAERLSDVLPAQCNCDRPMWVDGWVYQCGNAYELSRRETGKPDGFPGLRCSAGEDWVGFFRKVDRFNQPICSRCLANGRVWSRVPHAEPQQEARRSQ